MTRGRKPDQNAIRRVVAPGAIMQAEERVGVAMPPDIKADPVQSQIWAWIAPPTNSFTDQDIPNLRLLCYWHAVAAQAQQAIHSADGKINIFDKIGIKPFKTPDGREVPLVRKNPALTILKEASAEIRALSDQLGLSPLARSRIGLMDATTIKTAADTAAMFAAIDEAYGELPEADIIEIEAQDAQD